MNKRSRKILGFITLIAIVAIPLVVMKQLGIGKEEIRAYVEQLGVWAPLGLFCLRFTSVVIPALPGTAYSVLSGGLLGFGRGMAVVCLSDLLSCSLSFWLASRFGRAFVRRLVGDRFMSKVDSFSKKKLREQLLSDERADDDQLFRLCGLWCWASPHALEKVFTRPGH